MLPQAPTRSSAPFFWRIAGSRQPVLYAALTFAAGGLIAGYAWRPSLWWLTAALAFATAGFLLSISRGSFAYLTALSAVFFAGAFAASVPSAPLLSFDGFTTGDEIVVSGWVARDGLWRNAGEVHSARQSFDVQVEHLERKGRTSVVAGLLRVTVYPGRWTKDDNAVSESPAFAYGERIRFTAMIRPPRNFGNPGALDYAEYLRDQGIAATASVRADRIERLPGTSGSLLGRFRSRARLSIFKSIDALWPGEQANLLKAMLIGEASLLGRDTKRDFQRTGAYHILVVSGMNVGILAMVVFWTARRLRLPHWLSGAAAILLCSAYAYLCDAGEPIVRATLMLAIYLIARYWFREHSVLNAIGIAVLIVMVADSRAIGSASFQLTFLAVLAIGGIAAPLLERTIVPYSRALRHLATINYDLSFAPKQAQFRIELRMVAARLARVFPRPVAQTLLIGPLSAGFMLTSIFAVSAIMQVALALPMAIYFHRVTAFGLPVNLIIVPLTGILMPAALLALVFHAVAPVLAAPAAWVASAALQVMTATVGFAGGLRFADFRIPDPPVWASMLATLSLVLAMATARKHRITFGLNLTVLALTALLLALARPHLIHRAAALEITAIDVGQGEALLIVTSEGKTLLIDAGGSNAPSDFDYGENVVSPYLWSRGIERLDAIAFSHAQRDHIGGLPSVIANFRPSQVWIAPTPATSALDAVLASAAEVNAHVIQYSRGDRIQLGSAELSVVSPDSAARYASKVNNDDSLVLLAAYEGRSALLTGDIEKKAERALTQNGLPDIDLLKIAHHGSNGSTTEEFVTALKPEFAVISAGFRNQYKHPRHEVLQRLAGAGVRTFRTDLHGASTIYLTRGGVEVKTGQRQ